MTALAMPRPGHAAFVTVHAQLVYRNNRAATRQALAAGAAGTPSVAGVLAARHAPANPFFTPE